MSISISNSLVNQLKKDYDDILKVLNKKDYLIEDLPKDSNSKKESGEVFTLAYPIQGILKYHGFANLKHRIAYFSSISLNNNCAFTISYLKLDKKLKKDRAYINGKEVFGDDLGRIKSSLDYIRNYSKVNTKAILISRNLTKSSKSIEMGKGLGTSASGSSALSLAAAYIIYDNDQEYLKNKRLMSIFSRYLSGSGTRSASGGFSLWLSHPKINPLDCFAIRLDKNEHQSFMDKISLITIPIKSDLKTYHAHKIAPKSLFFPIWLKRRKKLIIDFINALDNYDLNKIGEIAELDTLMLHSVAMNVPNNQKIIAWEPDTLKIMHKVNELQKSGYDVYYSIDTGPSLVLLTYKKEKKEILNEIKSIDSNLTIIEGKIGGTPKILNPESLEAKKLENDIHEFIDF